MSPPALDVENGKGHASADLPPAYDETMVPEYATIPSLNLNKDAGSPRSSTVTPDQCVAHLKLLSAFADLRDSISTQDGLFDLHDAQVEGHRDGRNHMLAKIREKRWSVYVSRAAERYLVWWRECISSSEGRPTLKTIQNIHYGSITGCLSRIAWSQEYMPPLDVLMVWHSHMLNPRSFLEDCIRYGKMSFWATGFPWAVINECFNERTLEYDAGETAKSNFEQKAKLSWDNLQDPPLKDIKCPNCGTIMHVLWSAGHIPYQSAIPFEKFYGFADKSLNATCSKCRYIVTHDKLKVAKFRRDVQRLLERDSPMPGTLYNLNGIPESAGGARFGLASFFPNWLLQAVGKDMLMVTHPLISRCENMADIRDELESKLRIIDVLFRKAGKPPRRRIDLEEKVAFRRMMSSYWENTSAFSIDLVGAVIRQGTFVQKMDNIDWLHSPTAMETMTRLINKYKVFFHIMVTNPKRMAVPTLDVDLAWHTHQLSPSRYFQYSILNSNLYSISHECVFIDHDDKVREDKLSDSFEWTSKMYKKITNGEIYSECTCWYCEAIRAPDLRSGIFVSTATARARETAAALHNRDDISSDPERNPHISAHNAVKPTTLTSQYSIIRSLKAMQLQSNYERARRRAEKRERRNSKDPKNDTAKEKGKDRKNSNDGGPATTAFPIVWGVPVYMPYHAPYMCDPGVHPDAYAANPACMNLTPGGYGNCAAGTCGGAVAAGSCGGLSGGCAGGAVGGSCASGGGYGGGGGCGGGCGGGGGGGC